MHRLVELKQLEALPPLQQGMETRSWFEPMLKTMATGLGVTPIGTELSLYLGITNALWGIACHVLHSTKLQKYLLDWHTLAQLSDYEPHLLRAFVDFAHRLGVLENRGNAYRLTTHYRVPIDVDCDVLLRNISTEHWQIAVKTIRLSHYRRELMALAFIFLLNRLRQGDLLNPRLLCQFGVTGKWQRLVAKKKYDYQIILCGFVLELLKVNLVNKVSFSGDVEFYTELGRQVFHLFTKENFRTTIQELVTRHKVRKVLDIGCGYGDYIATLRDVEGIDHIIGVEQQEKVATETANRFANDPRVDILNINVFDLEADMSADLVLLNYVLFYFSPEDKRRLFKILRNRLSKNGIILICQYYPYLEKLRSCLATLHGAYSLDRRIEMYFGGIVLYAEVLLNETLDHFQRAEYWESFNELIQNLGLNITYVTNADRFYYSLFVCVTHDQDKQTNYGYE